MPRRMAIDKMEQFETPRKKMRLDPGEWDDDLSANDDIWGQGEITAEEFDMLEMEATQTLQNTETVELQIASTSAPKFSINNGLKSAGKIDEWKEQRYALEGKIKILNDSLSKTVHELNRERLNGEKLMVQKTEAFQKQQQVLKDEIEKLQTNLHFKEQEMKCSHDKVCCLEQKLEKLKNNNALTASQQLGMNRRSPKKFLNRFQFEKSNKKTMESAAQTVGDAVSVKTYHLPLISPRGDAKGGEILSNLLVSQKQSILSVFNHSLIHSHALFTDEFENVSTALARLNTNQETDGIWNCYDKLLKQHISFLESDVFINQDLVVANNTKMTENAGNSFVSGSQSPFHAGRIDNHHHVAMQCLRDLNHLLVWQTPQANTCQLANTYYEQMVRQQLEQGIPMCSAPLFNYVDGSAQDPPCLLSLLTLAKEQTYHDSYSYKKEELLLVFNALVSWSSQSPLSIGRHLCHLPLLPLASDQTDIPCTLLTLQLLTNLIHCKEFNDLLHQKDSCIFTSIAGLCHIITDATNEDAAAILNLVECFLCSTVAVLGTGTLQDENCQCSSQIAQGFVLMLWHLYQVCQKDLSSIRIRTLKKGIVCLYHLYTHVKNFREKRAPVEDHYVLLICGLSQLIKENLELKFLSDTVRELWDFQDEGGEFDSDE